MSLSTTTSGEHRPTRADRRAARLDDPRFERLRSRRPRRLMVAALVALLAVEGAVLLALPAYPVAAVAAVGVLVLVFVVLLGALKASTRGVEELPASHLDERQVDARGAAFTTAYRIGLVLLWALGAAAFLLAQWDVTPTYAVVQAVVLLTLHTSLVLPTLVAAWTEPEPVPEPA